MTNNNDTNKSFTRAAVVSGASILVMTILSLVIFPSLTADFLHIGGIILIILLDVVIGLGLYIFLKPADKNLAVISSSLRVIYALFFAIALSQISNIDLFNSIWDKSLLIFGFHLLFLGILILKATYIPKLFGYLVAFTSLGYIIDGLGKFLGYTTEITMLTFWGEILFGVWLVIKGRKLKLK